MKANIKSKDTYKQKGGEKKMRYSKIILALGVGVFLFATLAFLTNTWAKENIRNTKHNLSTTGLYNIKTTGTTSTTGTAEICVFCHTPHGANTAAYPLWNRASSSATYVMYSGVNIDGTIATTPQGVSLACLSCHDGTVAFDQLFNAPGSGGNNGGNSAGFTFNNDITKFDDGSYAPFPNLGPNLMNDHPISIEICKSTQTEHDSQFTEACTNGQTPSAASKGTGTGVLLIRRTDGSLPSDVRDAVRAYKNTAGGWNVECASCHNPHENSSRFLRYQSAITGGAGTYPAQVGYPTEGAEGFTDVDRNKGSLLCLSCHAK